MEGKSLKYQNVTVTASKKIHTPKQVLKYWDNIYNTEKKGNLEVTLVNQVFIKL